jgi:hypothetical protein
MRSTGLTAADWAVITEYQDCLEPLKLATERLEGRGKAGKFGAIYEIIPVFEYILGALEARTRPFERVDFNPTDAPEDHLIINLRAAWAKANKYYEKLDDSPAYYAAVCLDPYYKYYCDNSWANKPEWLTLANAGFQRLWSTYKPHRRPLSRTTTTPATSGIDDVIGAFVHRSNNYRNEGHDDEFKRWKTQEPGWSREQYLSDGNAGNPVQYWIQMRANYPCLSQFAIDTLTVPASSCDCERLFSELGDLLEPKRRAIGSELLAALQLVRSWIRAGFNTSSSSGSGSGDQRAGNAEVNGSGNDKDEQQPDELSDEAIVRDYNINTWVLQPE